MHYSKALEIPANTLEASTATGVLKLTRGVIHRVEIEFPKGCVGLVYFKVKHREHQIWPTNQDAWYRSEQHAIVFDEYFQLYEAPYELNLEGYNLDDTWPHSPVLRVGVLPRSVAEHVFGKPTRKEADALREAFGLKE